MSALGNIWRIAARECGIMRKNLIYPICMVFFPILVIAFFTSIMHEGQPQEMPIGVVDLDNSSTSRSLVRILDNFQTSQVVSRYPSVNDARLAIQRNEIYAFFYIPKGTTDDLLAQRQPKISFYYSSASLTAGGLLYRDMKTVAVLGSAAVGKATMQAKGYTDEQIMAFMQPITIDAHTVNNPWVNYNYYLSTMLIPGCILLFVFLITAYSFGTELKFNRAKELMAMANNNVVVAITGKMIPQTCIFLLVMFGYMFYVFGMLHFPHPGGVVPLTVLGILSVIASQGFGIFMFGLLPSLRMSMSVCSLWGVLSFTTAGSAFPVFAMDKPIEAISYLFPLRHYFMIYQISVLNAFPLSMCWLYICGMVAFAALPLLVLHRIRKALLEYEYYP